MHFLSQKHVSFMVPTYRIIYFLQYHLITKLRERLLVSLPVSRRMAIEIFGAKAIVHNVISAGAITAYCFWPIYGVLTFSLCTMMSLHVLFNCQVENLFLKASVVRYINNSSQLNRRNSTGRTSGNQVAPVKHFVVGITFPVSTRNTNCVR